MSAVIWAGGGQLWRHSKLYFTLYYATGLCLLFFGVFPEMDSMSAVMATNAAATIPALLRLLNFSEKFEQQWARLLAVFLNFVFLSLQIFGALIWILEPSPDRFLHSWALPVGLLLASCGWWESFVHEKAKVSPLNISVLLDITRQFSVGIFPVCSLSISGPSEGRHV